MENQRSSPTFKEAGNWRNDGCAITSGIAQRVARVVRQVPFAFIALATTVGCAHVVDRDTWQKPDLVIEKLAIRPGDRVADLGAGSGYFTFRLAHATGNAGRVYAIDIDDSALARIREQAQEKGVSQVQAVLGTTKDAALPEPVDLVFLCNAYHHLENRNGYFQDLKKYLRAGGRVAIIDLDQLPWFLFPLRNHRTEAATIRSEMSAAGYRLVQQYGDLELQNFQIFVPNFAPD